MTATLSDILLVRPAWNPPDHINRVGGQASILDALSDVDSVFMPGMIYNSDLSDTEYVQYTKVALFNSNVENPTAPLGVFGFNTKSNSIVSFAIEKDPSGTVLKNGSDNIPNRMTKPKYLSDVDFTEVHSDSYLDIGIIQAEESQGLWLRMICSDTTTGDPTDTFRIGVLEA